MNVLALIASLVLIAQPAPALKIVVLEGEGGVNIIQQKTAVRPLVEVRDRNNLPVSGATVTFTIGGGGQSAAFAGGAQTLTVTTNAAGQAGVSSLNAVSSGAFQIQVQAAYQGQIATAAISQTNFATAAAATQAGASAGGGGTASGAAGGGAAGGGGVSATTIGIVGIAGAAVAGGALAVTKVVGQGSDESFDTYNGSLSGQLTLISVTTSPQGQQNTCTRNKSVTGPMTIELFEGNATGRASAQVALTEVSVAGGCGPEPPTTFSFQRENTAVSGGPLALTFRGAAQFINPSTTYTLTFTGSHSGNTIAGSVRIDVVTPPTGPAQPSPNGSTSFSITLQR